MGRAYKQDGIWHLYKRGLGVPPPHYLTPVTAETATAILSKALQNMVKVKSLVFYDGFSILPL